MGNKEILLKALTALLIIAWCLSLHYLLTNAVLKIAIKDVVKEKCLVVPRE